MKFVGDFVRTLDAKNRIVLPPAFKSCLDGKPFYIVSFPKDKGNCLRIYDQEGIDEIMNNNVFVKGGGDRMQNFQRKLFSNMLKCELDAQSRFTITQKLLDLAGIDKTIQMNGVGTRIELWDPDNYAAFLEAEDDLEFEDFSPDI